MSEEQNVNVPEFATVGAFLEHLKQVTDETLDTAYVTSTLEEILSRPAKSSTRRGQLHGLNLQDMTDEQLKREIINANSVLYKAKKRGASDETIAANQSRVDAAIAEKNSRPSMAKAEKPAEEVAAEEAGETEAHPVEGEL